MFSPLVDQLISALRVLPGVGPKSAQRMALHLLEHDRHGANTLARALSSSVEHVKRCELCRNLTEKPRCYLCSNAQRQPQLLCIVETPADVIAMEQSGMFNGRYFVLLGRLSPIDGVGPSDIGLDILEKRMSDEPMEEIIIATNPTVEGEATAHYISSRAKKYGITVSRIAHGVPLGGELEYIDAGTLAHALTSRREL